MMRTVSSSLMSEILAAQKPVASMSPTNRACSSLTLSGIGNYTAGAICSIAYEIPKPAVDGNVLRVLSRLLESNEDIMKQSVRKKIENALEEIIPEDDVQTEEEAQAEEYISNENASTSLGSLLAGLKLQ